MLSGPSETRPNAWLWSVAGDPGASPARWLTRFALAETDVCSSAVRDPTAVSRRMRERRAGTPGGGDWCWLVRASRGGYHPWRWLVDVTGAELRQGRRESRAACACAPHGLRRPVARNPGVVNSVGPRARDHCGDARSATRNVDVTWMGDCAGAAVGLRGQPLRSRAT